MQNDKTEPRSWIQRIRKAFGFMLFCGIAVLLLFEMIYRWQWIDFYSSEWEALNATVTSGESKPSILIFGDSFSADPQGWVGNLRSDLPNYNIYNAAIPGIGVLETNLIAPNRIEEVQPDICIYQVYPGNDLTDIERPTNWAELSFTRNLYWTFSDLFLSLRLVNYRLGQFRSFTGDGVDWSDAKLEDNFAPEHYSARSKLYLQSDSSLIDRIYFPDSEMSDLYTRWMDGIIELKESLPEETAFYVAIIPHCTATDSMYRSQFRQLGAHFGDEWDQTMYPGIMKFQKALEEAEINFIDLHNTLQNVSQHAYYQNDPHLNPTGQKILAKEVNRTILP